MAFVQTDATVQVDLAVTRYRPFTDDGIVEMWGYVGDYEVCVHLPLDDPRVRTLLAHAGPAAVRTPRRPSRGAGAGDEGA